MSDIEKMKDLKTFQIKKKSFKKLFSNQNMATYTMSIADKTEHYIRYTFK